MINQQLWTKLHFNPEGRLCNFCGQNAAFPKEWCSMCETHRTGIVLSIFRNMLMKEGDFKLKSDEENKQMAFREVAVGRCLKGFSPLLRQHCLRYKIVLENAGIWFSHMVAYTNTVFCYRYQDLFINDLIVTPEYRMIRSQAMQYLMTKNPDFTPEKQEMMDSLMAIPNSEMDAQRVLHSMLMQLEEEERIKIEYPKNLCLGCGTQIRFGRGICDECQKDESIRSRLSILKNEGTRYAKRTAVEQAVEKLGMYTRQEK